MAKNGFTLIELLISMTILSIIVSVLATAFGVGIRAWETGEKRGESLCTYRITIDRIERDIKSIYPYKISSGLDKAKKYIAFVGSEYELRCVSLAPSFVNPRMTSGIRGLHYYVKKGDSEEESGLMLEETFSPDESFFKSTSPIEMPEYCVDPSITYIEFQYYTKKSHEKESIEESIWESEYNLFSLSSIYNTDSESEDKESSEKKLKGLPTAIRVNLKFLNEKGEEDSLPPLIIPVMAASSCLNTASKKY